MKDEIWQKWVLRQVSEDEDRSLRLLVSTDATERSIYKQWLVRQLKTRTTYAVFPDWSLSVTHKLPAPDVQPFLLYPFPHIGVLAFLRVYRAPNKGMWVVLPHDKTPILVPHGEDLVWEDPTLGDLTLRFKPFELDRETLLGWSEDDLSLYPENDPRTLTLARGVVSLLSDGHHPIRHSLEHIANVTGDLELLASLACLPPLPDLSILRGAPAPDSWRKPPRDLDLERALRDIFEDH